MTAPASSPPDPSGVYVAFMEEVKIRFQAVDNALKQIDAQQGGGDAFLKAEFCYLQLRLICEIIALSVLMAHNELPETTSNAFLDK